MYGFQPRLYPRPPASAPNPAALQTATDFHRTIIQVRDQLLRAKIQQADSHNQHRAPDPEYKEGDEVLLSTVNIRQRMTRPGQVKKLLPFWIGPYKILSSPHPNSYKLDLPTTMQIHPGFNVK